jgi:hypothetical protein
LSLRATRRSLIAAITVGASLAIASSASAIPVPIGSSSDAAYSGTGTPTSVYSLYNEAANGLISAQNLIVGANALSQAPFDYGSPVDTNFTTKFTQPSDLDAQKTIVSEIATDISTAANNSQMEMAVCVFDVYPKQTSDTNVGDAFGQCTANGSQYLAAAVAAYTPATTSSTIQNGVATAAAAYPDLDALVTQLKSASGTLYSMDTSGVNVSSSGTVVSTADPFEYDIKLSAPSGGYIIPSAFSLTFPAGLSVNTSLVSDEVNAAANGTTASDIAAVEANPSGTSIGTVTLTSPVADNFGGTNNQFVGKIYVVTTGATSGQGSATQPYLELWFTSGIYDMGSFPNSLAFPLTLTFGEATVAGLGQEPLPINSLEVNFPAATSPAKTSSCTTLGTAGATATDAISNLALEFGDTTDGLTSPTGTASALTLAATPTAVTNQCTATVTTVKNTLSASMSGLTGGTPKLSFKVGTTGAAFGTVTVGLPSGLKFAKSTAKKLAKEVSGSKIKSVKIAGGKLVITLKSKVKSETIKTKKGLINESAALIKKIKKHKTKKLNLSVKAGTFTVKASVKA